MRTFVLRARTAPTATRVFDKFLTDPENHLEVVCHVITNSLLVSKRTREDVILHIVCEGAPEPTKIITLTSAEIGSLGGFDEQTIYNLLKNTLQKSMALGNDEIRSTQSGISIRKYSFEKLIRDLVKQQNVYILSKKGKDIRETKLENDSCFIFTDHIPMQKNTLKLLKRIGVKDISLGPKMLFASQCIVLIHNEIDRQIS